jgi:hypothetical protein
MDQLELTFQIHDEVIKPWWLYIKKIKINYKVQFQINTMLKDEIEKKLKKISKNNLNQYKLT